MKNKKFPLALNTHKGTIVFKNQDDLDEFWKGFDKGIEEAKKEHQEKSKKSAKSKFMNK